KLSVMRPRAFLAVVPLLIAGAVAACGDDGGGTASTTTGASTTTSAAATTAPSIAAETSTRPGVEAAPWASGVTVTMNDDGPFTFQSNGIPNHARAAQYLVPTAGQPGAVPQSLDDVQEMNDPTTAQDYSFTITLTPTYTATMTATSGGTIGVIISGAALFNPY